MTDVFNIAGELKVNVTKFNTKIEEARKNLNSFKARTNKATRKIKKAFKGISSAVGKMSGALGALGGISAAGLGVMSTRAQMAAKAIGELAETTQSTTREVQGLMLAFREQDLDLDDVGDALNTIADRAQDAKDGMQSFIDDFGLIGVSVDDLRGKRPAELFDTFADAVARTEDPVKRQSAIVRVLGDDLGRKLAPALIGGSKHFRDFTDQAEKAGLIMEAGTIKQAREAAKSLGRLRSVVQAGLTKAFAQMAPFIQTIANRLLETINAGVDFGNLMPKAMNAVIGPIGAVLDVLQKMEIAWLAVKRVAVGVTAALSGAVNGFMEGVALIANGIKDGLLMPLKAVLRVAAQVPGTFGAAAKRALNEINSFEFRPPKILDDVFKSQLEELVLLKREFDAKMAEAPPSEGLKQWVADIQLQAAKIREVTAATEELRIKSAQTAIQSSEQMKKWTTATEALGAKLRETAVLTNQQWKKESEEMGTTIRSTLGEATRSALEGDFKSIGDSFKNMLQKMVADAMAADIANAIGLPGASASGGLGTGGSGGAGLLGGLGSIFKGALGFEGGGFTGHGPRTGGIDGRGGMLRMVHPNETVIDHRKGGQQQPITVNMNVTMTGNESSGEIRRSANQLSRELKRQLAKV